jgi:hypothetical protein
MEDYDTEEYWSQVDEKWNEINRLINEVKNE